MTEREDFREFEERSKLPAIATKTELENIGARHFRGDNFEKGGVQCRVDQMQYQKDRWMYVWKRIGPNARIEQKPYLIHMEIRPDGYQYFETKEEETL